VVAWKTLAGKRTRIISEHLNSARIGRKHLYLQADPPIYHLLTFVKASSPEKTGICLVIPLPLEESLRRSKLSHVP